MAAAGPGAGASQPFSINEADLKRGVLFDHFSFHIRPNDSRRDESAQLDNELRALRDRVDGINTQEVIDVVESACGQIGRETRTVQCLECKREAVLRAKRAVDAYDLTYGNQAEREMIADRYVTDLENVTGTRNNSYRLLLLETAPLHTNAERGISIEIRMQMVNVVEEIRKYRAEKANLSICARWFNGDWAHLFNDAQNQAAVNANDAQNQAAVNANVNQENRASEGTWHCCNTVGFGRSAQQVGDVVRGA